MFALRVFLYAMLMLASLQGDLPLQNKIVYLISPPRSLSTVLMRSIEAYGNFEVMMEPSMAPFCRENELDFFRLRQFKPGAALSFADVKQKILTKALTSNVFVKEIANSVRGFLLKDSELLKNENVYFVFLLRNPHHTAISFYKKIEHEKKNIFLDQEMLSFLVGYKSSFELFEHVAKEATNKPCVLLSEDLYSDPQATLKALCNFLHIPFKSEMLRWSDLGDSFTGDKWEDSKMVSELVQVWHGAAIQSTEFKQPTQYLLDAEGKPSFAEIVNDERRVVYKAAYLENLPFYNQFFTEQNATSILKKT